MISDGIKFLSRYDYIPGISKVINFLNENDVLAIENGKYDLGDECSVKVMEYVTHEEPEEVLLEAHREYLDLQIAVKGTETFVFQAIDLGEPAIDYDKKKDVEFYTAQYYNSLVLDGSNFVIVFPNDLHVGNIIAGEECSVKKLVFKLKI
ncbi:MAG: YhcH/YjgK/YiaL family protein [Clostridia bacterium]|nr:YhcH/YjgK/YiaL family protein [Clostridia bacterium]